MVKKSKVAPGKGKKFCKKCSSLIGSPCKSCPSCGSNCHLKKKKDPVKFVPFANTTSQLLIMPYKQGPIWSPFGN